MHGEDCAAIANDHSTHGLATLNALDDVKVHPMPQTAALTRTDEPSIHDVIEPLSTRVGAHDSELVSPYEPKRNARYRARRMVEPDGIEPTT
jgi:hypothetical protein